MHILIKHRLKKFVCASICLSCLAIFAAAPIFATTEGETDADSEESAAQELIVEDGVLPSEEDILTLREIDDSAYAIVESPEVPLALLPPLGTWSFANLLIAVVGLIISALTVIALLAGKDARSEVSAEYGARRRSALRGSVLLKIIGAAIGVASVVLFLLTEDVHGVTKPVNGGTWLMALILFAQAAIVLTSFGADRRLRDLGRISKTRQ
jgi:hypothetical protein